MTALLPRLRWPDVGFAIKPVNLWIEVGAGSFEHAEAMARANPAIGLIACEVFENGIASLLSRIAPGDADPASVILPANLRLYPDDARALLRSLPDRALGQLFLMFPDPWPKARHAKRRFVHPDMIDEIARVMQSGAEWRIASDDPTYQQWVSAVFAAQHDFIMTQQTTIRPDDWPATRYEAKAIRAGRQPYYWIFRRV
ncbi:MAG: tRNA (guanine(46)-N(7))-methyltransferase TrmB [Acidiphilium sp.]